MKRSIVILSWLLALVASTVSSSVWAAPIKTLVIYDQGAAAAYKKLGQAYAIMLRNLLGHFDTSVDMYEVNSYPKVAQFGSRVDDYEAVFYLGTEYDNGAIPAAFLTDISRTQKTVVWFKYNLWKLAWDPAFDFANRVGFGFTGLYGLNAVPSAQNPAPGFFDTVLYKGNSLTKYYAYDAAAGTVNADPDIGATQITDPARVSVKAEVRNAKTGQQLPYIIQSGNFWYVADAPFSFIGPRDRYLVICDILHDMLGVNHAESHRALVRLEDVGALVDQKSMMTLTDYLYTSKIPFSIALIPFYRDPLGKYNNGVAQEIRLSRANSLRTSLNYALGRGAKIVMHGYTHQYGSTPNLYTAVSGDDFEFWNATLNQPVAEDSQTWADNRLTAGIREMAGSGYTAFAFEAPHYQASPAANRAAASRFAKTFQRVVYYTSEKPDLRPTSANRDFAVGQFFPYIIEKDYYGQRVLPENLGNIEYDISHIDPTSNVVYTAADIKLNAQYARLVRDGFASFFFHPFWLESSIGMPGFEDFKSTVEGITALGYTWVDASGL